MALNPDFIRRKSNETIDEFDKRINSLTYQHFGYAFFADFNYNHSNHTFSPYIIWNDKINSSLEDPLPFTGFSIHCSEKVRECLVFEQEAVPVFAKFTCVNGIINVTETVIRYFDRNYIVSYNGVQTQSPENVFFKGIPEINDEKYNEVLEDKNLSNSSFAKGAGYSVLSAQSSFRASAQNLSSFNLGSFNLGSFNLGSFNLGSFKLGSFNASAFNSTSFNTGSYNAGSFNLSSFNLTSFNLAALQFSSFFASSFWGTSFRGLNYFEALFTGGSYNVSSYNVSSFSLSSYMLSSFNLGTFGVNSFNETSFNLNALLSGSFNAYTNNSYNVSSFNLTPILNSANSSFSPELKEAYAFESLLKEIFGIGLMGYGLDLI